MKDITNRQLTEPELMYWVEMAKTGEEQQERAEVANAGYPVMLSELSQAEWEELESAFPQREEAQR